MGVWVGCAAKAFKPSSPSQPLGPESWDGDGERCVTPARAAAKETIQTLTLFRTKYVHQETIFHDSD